MTNTKNKGLDLRVNATTTIRFAEKQPKADIAESQATEKFGEIRSDEKSESWNRTRTMEFRFENDLH